MRPVIKGYCKLESLFDGSLDLEAIALANDAIDVMEENRIKAERLRQ